jgi:hypothetical protein
MDKLANDLDGLAGYKRFHFIVRDDVSKISIEKKCPVANTRHLIELN